MKITKPVRSILYAYSVFLPKSVTISYFRDKAATSPSLRALEPAISSKVAEFQISLNAKMRRASLVWLVLYVAYIIILKDTSQNFTSRKFSIVFIAGASILYIVFIGSSWRIVRSAQENRAVTRLFFAICFLEGNAVKWPSSHFRWQVARRLERIARAVERIPLASRSLNPGLKQEIFKLARSKAQAIRKLELWAIRPMAFTFTDLVQQLILDLTTVVDCRWYELPDEREESFNAGRSRWLYALQITAAIAVSGGAIALTVFAAKIGPAASIITLILSALAVALLNSAGISANVIDRYIQTGSKIVPGK